MVSAEDSNGEGSPDATHQVNRNGSNWVIEVISASRFSLLQRVLWMKSRRLSKVRISARVSVISKVFLVRQVAGNGTVWLACPGYLSARTGAKMSKRLPGRWHRYCVRDPTDRRVRLEDSGDFTEVDDCDEGPLRRLAPIAVSSY